MFNQVYFAPEFFALDPYPTNPPTKAHSTDAAFDLEALITHKDLKLVGVQYLRDFLRNKYLPDFISDFVTQKLVVNGVLVPNDKHFDVLDQVSLESIVLFSPYLLFHLQTSNYIHSSSLENLRHSYLVGTGYKLEIDYQSNGSVPAGLILPRSGLASKFNLGVANSPGLIDAGYRGEIKVALENRGFFTHVISTGSRIAQLLLTQASANDYIIKESLSDSDRGSKGFGSTGV